MEECGLVTSISRHLLPAISGNSYDLAVVSHSSYECYAKESGGEGSRTPVSSCYVQRRPRMLYQSHFRGEYVPMNKRGRTRMLLVLLLP